MEATSALATGDGGVTTWEASLRTEGRAVKCPNAGCDRTFTCDACLHLHLVRNYKLRWVDAFGPNVEPWVDFCDRHADCSPSMLGL